MIRLSAQPEQQIPLDRIRTAGRLRPVREEGVQAVIASIRDLGEMTDAILVRPLPEEEGAYQLMAGGHRVAAATALGWETIRARVYECSEIEARLFEIDDNVAQSGLTPLDFSVFMAERKRVYEELHPEARHGGDRKSRKFREEIKETNLSFCSAAGQVWGRSPKSIQRAVQVAGSLDPEVVKALQTAARPVNFSQLKRLSKLEAPKQRDVAQALLDDPGLKVTDITRRMEGGPTPASEAPEDKLLAAFTRLPREAQRRFLSQLCEEHPELVQDALQAWADEA